MADCSFGRATSQDLFCGGIPDPKGAGFIGHHHAVSHAIEYRLEEACLLAQFFLQPLAAHGISQRACEERGRGLSFDQIVLRAGLNEVEA